MPVSQELTGIFRWWTRIFYVDGKRCHLAVGIAKQQIALPKARHCTAGRSLIGTASTIRPWIVAFP